MLKTLALLLVLLMVVPTSAAFNLDDTVVSTGTLEIHYAGSLCFWELTAAARSVRDNTGKITFAITTAPRILVTKDATLGNKATYPDGANGPCPEGFLQGAGADLVTATYVTHALTSIHASMTCASASSSFAMSASTTSGDAYFSYQGTGVCQT